MNRLLIGIAAALVAAFLLPALAKTGTSERFDLMPRVMATSEATLHSMYCGATEDCESPLAIYANGVMYIRDDFDPRRERDRGILLHEFVHHLRFIGGESNKDCGTEAEAYQTQIAWYEARGVNPDDKAHIGKLLAGPLMRLMIYQQRCGGLQ